jgi:hypothetical protein
MKERLILGTNISMGMMMETGMETVIWGMTTIEIFLLIECIE